MIKTVFTAILYKYRKKIQMESDNEDWDQLDEEFLLKQQGKMDPWVEFLILYLKFWLYFNRMKSKGIQKLYFMRFIQIKLKSLPMRRLCAVA